MNHLKVIAMFDQQTHRPTDRQSDVIFLGYHCIKNKVIGASFLNKFYVMNHSEVIAMLLPRDRWTDRQDKVI